VRVLLLEDDLALARGLIQSLESHQYVVDHFDSIQLGLNATDQEHYDLVLLDLGLTDGDGFDFLSRYRQHHLDPVLILTARDTVTDKIQGLDLGADDYLAKPFDVSELHARMRALLRRSAGRANNVLVHGELELDSEARQVKVKGVHINLSRKEFNLVEVMLSNPGKVFSRSHLEQSLYNWDEDIESNALEVHIHNLRKKLGSSYIKTVRVVGYMMPKMD